MRIELQIFSHSSFYNMAHQHGGGYASGTAGNGSNCLHDFLGFLVIYVAAKLAFFIYVDSYIDDNLAFA